MFPLLLLLTRVDEEAMVERKERFKMVDSEVLLFLVKERIEARWFSNSWNATPSTNIDDGVDDDAMVDSFSWTDS